MLLLLVQIQNGLPTPFFFISDPFLTLAQKIGEAFLKNCPKKWFSNCLVDGLLNSIVKYSNILNVVIVYYRDT